MPSFSRLSQQQLGQLVDYLMTLGAGGTAPIQNHHHETDTASHSSTATQPPSLMTTPDPQHSVDPSSNGVSSNQISPQEVMGKATNIIGYTKHGAVLFTQNCQHCHGLDGTDKVPNPGSMDGTVPPLNPIDRELYNTNSQTFVDNIDPFIQHGSVPEGSNPELHMLPFGDQHMLTQAEISDLEAYVLSLNGVNRAERIHPGMESMQFFIFTVIAYGLILVGALIIWGTNRSRRDKNNHSLHIIDIMNDDSYKK